MNDKVAGGDLSRRAVGALFASIMAKANNADIMIFGTYAKYVPFNPSDITLTVTKQIMGYNNNHAYGYGDEQEGTFNVGHGTNFHEIFREANKKYDRIFIFSDQQGWEEDGAPTKEERAYRKKYNCNPFIYSFDLAGYGSMMFPANKVFALAGFSDKVFQIAQYLESDKEALINEILKIEL